jgi:hypothetical protein
VKLLWEIVAWVAFSAVVGLLSVWPRFEVVESERAIVTVTFSHAAHRVGECRQLTQEELNKLPPNMRKPSDCPRERFPMRVELRSDDQVLYQDVLLPSGIWSDGKANIYQRVEIDAGVHVLFVGMNDSGGDEGFNFENTAQIDIAPGRNVVIRFDPESGQFTIR